VSKRKLRTLILFLVVVSILLWVLGTKRDGGSTSELNKKFATDSSFRGRIAVTIIERYTGPERNLKFLIDLDRGEVSSSPNLKSEEPLSPGGRLDRCESAGAVEIPAPNHELAASCVVKFESDSYKVTIRDLRSDSQLREWSAGKEWEICGLVWSPDSKTIAVLLARERTDLSPLGLVSAASGHPIPLNTFKVTLLTAQSGNNLELPLIRKDSPSGWARVDWIR